jgi:hypothetical protein
MGNLTIATTGTRPFQGTTTAARTITVGGDMIVQSANFFLKAGSGVTTLNVASNYTQTGGTFTLRSSSTTGTGTS